MEGRVGSQLAESMLETAGSLYQLQEELDRISLRHCGSSESGGSAVGTPGGHRTSTRRTSSKKSHKKKKKKRTEDTAASSGPVYGGGTIGAATGLMEYYERSDQDAISLESGSYERPSSSSHFDSAIGSLHSQTDNDSLSSLIYIPPPIHPQPPVSYGGRGLRDSSTVVEATVEQYYSPQLAMPALVTAEPAPSVQYIVPEPLNDARRSSKDLENDDGSVQEREHTVTVMGTRTHVQLRSKTHKLKVHQQLTAEDARKHFEWLQMSESAGAGVRVSVEQDDVDSNARGQLCSSELENEGSSSTIVNEGEVKSAAVEIEQRQEECDDVPGQKYESAWVSVKPKHTKWASESPQNATKKDDKGMLSTQFYEDNLTPHDSPVPRRYQPSSQVNMRQRYHTTSPSSLLQEEGEDKRKRQPPKRNASILQRLRRRHGSFRQESRPRRRTPVQRSFSDRFVHLLKEKWVDHKEERHQISTPSFLRPIGRLLRTHAGMLHIIQLHKPPSGHFGIYISQVGKKIFISRFATAMAEKFYAGLLTPGDEIVSVNRERVRGKPLDSVYHVLAQLDSVVLAVVPITAHRNW